MKSLSDRCPGGHCDYLISDLHLDAGRPAVTRLLIDFLAGPARQARALYILGDLFEVWIGDDAVADPGEAVALAIRELSSHGVAIYFVVGNRDFLLGPDYCEQAGMTLLSEPVLLPSTDVATVLLHGDVLCSDDLDYQAFRRKVRNPAWQRRMLSRPIWWRRFLGRIARSISHRRNRSKPSDIMDVNADAVRETLHQHKARRMIHGHTHRPAFHTVTVDDRPCQRLVLGDWHDDRGSVIELREGSAWLHELTRAESGRIELKPISEACPAPDYSIVTPTRDQTASSARAAD